jgi:hypothetical protein
MVDVHRNVDTSSDIRNVPVADSIAVADRGAGGRSQRTPPATSYDPAIY